MTTDAVLITTDIPGGDSLWPLRLYVRNITSRGRIPSGFQHHLDGGAGLVLNGEPLGSIIQVEGM